MDTVSSYDVGHRLGGGQQDVPIPLTGSFIGLMADGLSPFPALCHPAVNGLGIQLLVGFFHAITRLMLLPAPQCISDSHHAFFQAQECKQKRKPFIFIKKGNHFINSRHLRRQSYFQHFLNQLGFPHFPKMTDQLLVAVLLTLPNGIKCFLGYRL